MSKAIVLRTKDDGRFWLVSFDESTVVEISAAAAEEFGVATEVEAFPAVSARRAAAAFPMHVVQ